MRVSFGRIVQHDERSRSFRAPAAPALRSVSHKHWGPVLDQGNLGSCTGNAVAQALNCDPLRQGRRLLTEASARSLYSSATLLDGLPGTWPMDDTGSSGLGAAKAAKKAGYITGYSHAFGLDEALAALVLSPVIVGTSWHQSMSKPDAAGYLKVSGSVVGGHEYAVIALDVRLERVTVLNSWGPGWGKAGKAYLTFADLGDLLDDEGDVVVLAPIAK